jgi:hypothetical protein
VEGIGVGGEVGGTRLIQYLGREPRIGPLVRREKKKRKRETECPLPKIQSLSLSISAREMCMREGTV